MFTMTWNTNNEGRLSARWMEGNRDPILGSHDVHNDRRSYSEQWWLVSGRQMVRQRLAPVTERPRMTVLNRIAQRFRLKSGHARVLANLKILCAVTVAISALVASPKTFAWGPTTSGPNFTGTAEVEPGGSWYFEPWFYEYLQPGENSRSLSMPQRFALGMGYMTELDLYPNFLFNTAGAPSGRTKTTSRLGVGNFHLEVKHQFVVDQDTDHLLALPAISLKTIFWFPSGNYRNLSPSAYGADQFGNGTWNEGIGLLIRKRFKPFELYFELDEILEDPTTVGGGYTFNNDITQVPLGHSLRMVDGDLLYCAAAFEHVLNDHWGLGYVIEFVGQFQSKQNLFFGRANAPSWSSLWAVPGLELTWPKMSNYEITWGAGVGVPVYHWDYPTTLTPLCTITFYYGQPRGE